jgi:hypothetical protein
MRGCASMAPASAGYGRLQGAGRGWACPVEGDFGSRDQGAERHYLHRGWHGGVDHHRRPHFCRAGAGAGTGSPIRQRWTASIIPRSSKTYSHDTQVADSAPTATAIMAGVKTRNGIIGIGPEASLKDCASGKGHELPSLMELAQSRGLATGVVTTTRITHATPRLGLCPYCRAGTGRRTPTCRKPPRTRGCVDIARQLVEGRVGVHLDVVMGGGRTALLPQGCERPRISR